MKCILLTILAVVAVGAFLTPGIVRSPNYRYTIGKRVARDYMVLNTTTQLQWYARPQNISIRYGYPLYGAGKNVTYVEVVVGQSSNNGTAYVSRGGIGQKFIEITVLARNTTYYNATVMFYGK